MTNDLTTNLRAAGDLLDERGEAAFAQATSDPDERVFPLATHVPKRPRSQQAIFAAAAAVLLVMATVAVIGSNRSDQQLPVASPANTVALIPSEGKGAWDHLDVGQYESRAGEASATAWVARSGTEGQEQLDQSAAVSVYPAEFFAGGLFNGTGVRSESGVTGQLATGTGNGRVILYLDPIEVDETLLAGYYSADTPTDEVVITVTAGPGLDVEELFDLAAELDFGTAFEDQTFGDEWDLITRQSALVDTSGRTFNLSHTTDGGGEIVRLWGHTVVGAADEAMWSLSEPFVARLGEVRGKPAIINLDENYGASVTWIESPGVTVKLTYSAQGALGPLLTDDEFVAEVLAAAEDLVPVDRATWDRFSEEANPPGHSEYATTTMVSEDGAVIEDPADAMSDGVRGQIENLGAYRVYERTDGALCWIIYASDAQGCSGTQPQDRTLPRWAGPSVSPDRVEVHLVYGFAAEGSTEVRVVLEGAGQIETSAAVTDGIWAVAQPPGFHTTAVEYLDRDGNVIERHDVPLTED